MSTFIHVNSLREAGCLACGVGSVEPAAAKRLKRDLSGFTGGRVTLGGAEPTRDGRLAAMVAALKARGAEEIVVETDGVSAALPGFAELLARAGVSAVRLRLGAVESAVWDPVSGCPEHIADAWLGAQAYIAAGIDVSVEIPLARSNVEQVGFLVAAVKERLPEVTSLTLRPVSYTLPVETSAHARDVMERAEREMVEIPELAQALGDSIDASEGAPLRVVFDARAGLPLCALRERPKAIDAVRRRNEASRERPDACYSCSLQERCGGQDSMHARLFGVWPVQPFSRVPRALVRNTSPEPIVLQSPGLPSARYGFGHKAEIRVVMPCNQDCTFCFVNREAPNPKLELLERAVDQAAAGGALALVFTGGEPTLSPHLPALIERARNLGVPCRGIQTNALRLVDSERVKRLVDAGLNHAHVSLHAVDSERYKAITGFGEPSDAALGARHLVDAGVEVSMSLVICQENYDHMAPTLHFIREAIGRVKIVLSVAREQHGLDRPWDKTLLTYHDAASAMVEALEVGRRLGLDMGSAGTCSMPPCVLPDDKLALHVDEVLVQHREMSWESPGEEESAHVDANVFVSACNECDLRSRCPGIQGTYLERRGPGEFRPVSKSQLS